MRNKKIRYAVVGLGHIAQTAVLPAFKHAENSELAAVVTGNREKDRKLSKRYRVKAYAYDDLEAALEREHAQGRVQGVVKFYAIKLTGNSCIALSVPETQSAFHPHA